MLRQNNCHEAFWLGNLKHKNTVRAASSSLFVYSYSLLLSCSPVVYSGGNLKHKRARRAPQPVVRSSIRLFVQSDQDVSPSKIDTRPELEPRRPKWDAPPSKIGPQAGQEVGSQMAAEVKKKTPQVFAVEYKNIRIVN